MAEPSPTDTYAFEPFEGGRGVRVAVTTSSSRGFIPGTQATGNMRVLVYNSGLVEVHVRLGQSDVVATTDCIAIPPRWSYVLTAPSVSPSGLWVAGITYNSGSTSAIQATAGKGT